MARKTGKRRKSALLTEAPEPTRRMALRTSALWGAAGALTLTGGAAFARNFRCHMEEADLTRVGNGMPTVVQIHDPSCALCRSLQRETRAALDHFDGVQYLVANVRSDDGARFANTHGLPHVTLLLLDGEGRTRHVVRGVTPEATLIDTVARHLRLTPAG